MPDELDGTSLGTEIVTVCCELNAAVVISVSTGNDGEVERILDWIPKGETDARAVFIPSTHHGAAISGKRIMHASSSFKTWSWGALYTAVLPRRHANFLPKNTNKM